MRTHLNSTPFHFRRQPETKIPRPRSAVIVAALLCLASPEQCDTELLELCEVAIDRCVNRRRRQGWPA